jgi:hypothetical protein
MKKRFPLPGVLLLGALLVAAGVAARTSSARSGNEVQWDYGILRTDTLTWRQRGRIIEQMTGPDFAAAMNTPYSNDSDVFEINLLNCLGDRGWELVDVPRGSLYVFKRAR